jgi:hypothetical protein
MKAFRALNFSPHQSQVPVILAIQEAEVRRIVV